MNFAYKNQLGTMINDKNMYMTGYRINRDEKASEQVSESVMKSSTYKILEVYGDDDYYSTLTIEPGTNIEFDDSTYLRIGKTSWYPFGWHNYHPLMAACLKSQRPLRNCY